MIKRLNSVALKPFYQRASATRALLEQKTVKKDKIHTDLEKSTTKFLESSFDAVIYSRIASKNHSWQTSSRSSLFLYPHSFKSVYVTGLLHKQSKFYGNQIFRLRDVIYLRH